MSSLLNRNIGIDFLRGLSILYIVGFWHMFNYTTAFPEYNNILTYRFTLVILGTFVFISGYFVGMKDITINKHSIIEFYKQRLLRIYPLYLIAIILFTLLNLSNLKTSIKAGLLISMIIEPAPPTLWFIAMLMLFYVTSPLLIYASKTIQAKRLMSYYLITIIALIAYSYFTKKLDIRLVMYFPSFALGVFIANNNIELVEKKYNASALIVTTFCILLSFVTTPNSQLNEMLNAPMILLCSYFLFRVAKKIVFSSNQTCRVIAILSYSSYCMYLFHRPIYIILNKFYFPEEYLYQVVYLVVFCMPCILLFSFIFQKAFDITINALTTRSSGRAIARR
jgi:peptidoglycan/LPS O-acetylase OafA/YrhL